MTLEKKTNPKVTHTGTTFKLEWDEGVAVIFRRLKEGRKAEGEFEIGLTKSHKWVDKTDTERNAKAGSILGPFDVDLKSMSRQKDLVKSLTDSIYVGPVAWNTVIRTSCNLALKALRKPSEVHIIGAGVKQFEDPTQVGYTLSPVMRVGKATGLYGTGGTGKSMLAIYWCMLITSGQNGPSLEPVGAQEVLYLDWETDEADFEERVFALQEGHPELEGAAPHYRNCAQSFLAEFDDIRQYIIKKNIGVVVVDSFEAALGANSNEGESVQPVFNALRQLNCTILVIDHKSKEDAAREESQGPIGSVMKLNRLRSVYELVQEPGFGGEDEIVVGMIHKKINSGKKQNPRGFRMSFRSVNEQLVWAQVTSADMKQTVKLKKSLPVLTQIQEFLTHDAATVAEISAATGLTQGAVRNKLTQEATRHLFQKVPGSNNYANAEYGRQAGMPGGYNG